MVSDRRGYGVRYSELWCHAFFLCQIGLWCQIRVITGSLYVVFVLMLVRNDANCCLASQRGPLKELGSLACQPQWLSVAAAINIL